MKQSWQLMVVQHKCRRVGQRMRMMAEIHMRWTWWVLVQHKRRLMVEQSMSGWLVEQSMSGWLVELIGMKQLVELGMKLLCIHHWWYVYRIYGLMSVECRQILRSGWLFHGMNGWCFVPMIHVHIRSCWLLEQRCRQSGMVHRFGSWQLELRQSKLLVHCMTLV